jgi:ABC-type lipoprotein export system ATPase subunit
MKTLQELKSNYDVSNFKEYNIVIPEKPSGGIVLLVGNSGSGKSTILKNWFPNITPISFDNSISVVENFKTIETGETLLKAFGLRSIPTWFRPFNTLSNGESHRAYCAKSIDADMPFIDEFTSVVDRDTAKSLSASIRKWYSEGLLVLATCHQDVEEWLCPDVIYDTDRQEFRERRYLWRPQIKLDIYPSTVKDWVLFKKHHYLSGNLATGCHCYTAYINSKPVAFVGVIHGTGRDIKTYWRESRLVVLPEFQGLGIGKAVSDAVAQEYKSRGLRYFSKTAHPILGNYRNSSKLWRGTTTNGKARPSYLKKDGTARVHKGFGSTKESLLRDSIRACFSHEYMGS